MSKNTLYEQLFKKSDGSTIKKYVWTSDINKEIYPLDENNIPMEPIFPEYVEGPLIITGAKMTPQQVQVERKQRSSQHFKKEILPTLGRDEKLHFGQKFAKDKK